MNKHAAIAIVGMAEGRIEYNRGVLGVLGKADLAEAFAAAAASLGVLVEKRGELYKADDFFRVPSTPEQRRLEAQIDEASRHKAAQWAPIQSLIDEARTIADPILSEILP